MLLGFGTETSDIIHMFEDIYQICNRKDSPIQNVTMDNGGVNLAIVTFDESHVDKSNVTSSNELSTSSTSNEAHVEPSLPTRHMTRSMTAASTKVAAVATANEQPTFIVTGNTNPTRLNFENDHSSVSLISPFLYHT